jgi:hypothetical protein
MCFDSHLFMQWDDGKIEVLEKLPMEEAVANII